MIVFKSDDASRLLELLDREFEAFGQMLEMTAKQTELIEADDIETFDKSLDTRQKLIEKINGLHQESTPLMQSYISYSNSAGGGAINRIEDARSRLGDIVSECASRNDSLLAAAKEKAGTYTSRIDKLSMGRKSMGAYIQSVANTPEMFDKKM